MKKLTMILGVLLLGTFFVAGSSMALEIWYGSPANDGILIAVDQGANDASDVEGVVTVNSYNINSATYGNWLINISSYVDQKTIGNTTYDSFHYTLQTLNNTPGAGKELDIWLGDTGVYGTDWTFDLAISPSSVGDGNSVTVSHYTDPIYWSTWNLDDGPTYVDDGKLIDSFAATYTEDAAIWTYLQITNESGNTFSVDYDLAPVPEPATMLLLGFGLIGIAGASRKKLFKK